MYADKVALIADDADHLAAMLTVCNSVALHLGFRFALSKCKIIAGLQNDLFECRLHGKSLTRSQSSKYLAVQMTACGINKKAHVQHLTNNASSSARLFRFLPFNASFYSTAVCRKVHVTFVLPQLEYELALINQRMTTLKQLESAQHAILCMLRPFA